MKLAIAAALLALAACRAEPGAKPDLYVMTSLPLLFDEGFSVEPATGEAAVFLREHYTLKPIDLPSRLPQGVTLLAAQPRALPAEELVALDAWVRGGGKMLLLADPMLEWPSNRPLGDRLRPPLAYPDTGLLAHWGLRLDAPDEPGPTRLGGGHFPIVFLSAGRLVAQRTDCALNRANIEAICSVGHGTAIIVADADWINADLVVAVGGTPKNQMSELKDMLAESGAK